MVSAEITPEVVTAEALTWPDRARAALVTDDVSYRSAASLLLGIKDLRKAADAAFDPIITAAHAAHKTAIAQKMQAEGPLIEAERIIKASLRTFDDVQEAERQRRQREADEQARREEEDRVLAQAAALEAEGHEWNDPVSLKQAEQLVEEAIQAPMQPVAPVVQKATPAVAGISFREEWKFEVTDLRALVQHVATHPEHSNLLQANTAAIGGLVRSLKSHTNIPGVRAFAQKAVAAGRR